ncbi:hypothetical protein CLOM_g16651, partial [Closterium sp. NIES-68]
MDLSSALLLLLDGSIRILTNLHPERQYESEWDLRAASQSSLLQTQRSEPFAQSHTQSQAQSPLSLVPRTTSCPASSASGSGSGTRTPLLFPFTLAAFAGGDIIRRKDRQYYHHHHHPSEQLQARFEGDSRRPSSTATTSSTTTLPAISFPPRGVLSASAPHLPADLFAAAAAAAYVLPPPLLVRDVLRDFPGCAVGMLDSSRAHLPPSARIQAGGVYFLLPAGDERRTGRRAGGNRQDRQDHQDRQDRAVGGEPSPLRSEIDGVRRHGGFAAGTAAAAAADAATDIESTIM